MRDWLVTSFVLVSLPFILARPYIGALMWAWVSVMNPHRLAWGFAYDFPFAMVIALTTCASLLLRIGRLRFPWSGTAFWLLLFVGWMCVTTYFALVPDDAREHWKRVMSIMFMTFITMLVLEERHQIEAMVWVLALSVGFYGVKGGVFTLLGGGQERVFGPSGSNLSDNNDLALALVMTLPLFLYLIWRHRRPRIRWPLIGATGLTVLAALGCYSRGGMLALAAVAFMIWLRGAHAARNALLLLVVAALALSFMPERWRDRMWSISTYEEDHSAKGRIDAWQLTVNVALARPFVGGGFQIYQPEIYKTYAPDSPSILGAHSIYFSALGEHGFIGALLLLALGVSAWRMATRVVRRSQHLAQLEWAANLGRAMQLCLVGYAVGGLFLGMLYFDLPYFMLAILVALDSLVTRTLRENEAASRAA